MHLLSTSQFSSQTDSEPIDLNHSPADVVFLSSADTELSLINNCVSMRSPGFDIRLGNLMMLNHPLAVDIYCEKTIRKSKITVIRLLGGFSYWPYGIEAIAKCVAENNGILIALPGDDSWDENLARYSNVKRQIQTTLASCLIEGGIDNAACFLEQLKSLLEHRSLQKTAKKLLKAGYYKPGEGICSIAKIKDSWQKDQPTAIITFYRALLQSGMTKPIDVLWQNLIKNRINPLAIFVSSLKEQNSIAIVANAIEQVTTDIIINATAFAATRLAGGQKDNILAKADCPILQVIISQSSEDEWQQSARGLNIRDLSMNIVLPELDGRLSTQIISFKKRNPPSKLTGYGAVEFVAAQQGIEFVCKLAANYCNLRKTNPKKRKIAIIMPNYPNRDGRLANGVGLDTPQSAINILAGLKKSGYQVEERFKDGNCLIETIQKLPTNANPRRKTIFSLAHSDYIAFFDKLPKDLQKKINQRWGKLDNDPFFNPDTMSFRLTLLEDGKIIIGIQPDRGYSIDIEATYHDSELIPPHNYFAFYAFLRHHYGVHAIIHLGKHGNLEWLPGKAMALGQSCCPRAIMGDIPHFYPFIINNPGEGMQAKRRNHATIIDHLTPAFTRAGNYGKLAKLEALIDEYYQAKSFDDKRSSVLSSAIIDMVKANRFDVDFKLNDDLQQNLLKIDNRLCEIKELQIRDGLHIFASPMPEQQQAEFVNALLRPSRTDGKNENMSLLLAISKDAGLTDFNPFDFTPSDAAPIVTSQLLKPTDGTVLRNNAKLIEAIEKLSINFITLKIKPPKEWLRTNKVLKANRQLLLGLIDKSTEMELKSLLAALDGRYIRPGAAGAPSRGRIDVLPSGKNFYSIDTRIVPTQSACQIGSKSAYLLLQRHIQEHGEYPQSIGLSVWGTANMRTGGDDLAQALALMGAQPLRDGERIIGFEIIPIKLLGRPRVDVTLRVSGFFRDAFPDQIQFFDKIVQEIAKLEEADDMNPIAANIKIDTKKYIEQKNMTEEQAFRYASLRVFSAKPGSYGTGLQNLMDTGAWQHQDKLAENWLQWSSYAYGENYDGLETVEAFRTRIEKLDVVMQNQDNREHDIFDSDDYYQFQGGMALSHRHLSGSNPVIYHNDHSKPERPVIRSLQEEVTRVLYGRVLNPKWLQGVMRHGYKGGFEMAATIDYLFAYAVTTEAVLPHHFDLVYETYIENDEIRSFLQNNNPQALKEMSDTLLQANKRSYWQTKSNSAIKNLELIKKK